MKETLHITPEHEVLVLVTGISFANVPARYGSTRRDLHMDLIVPKFREGHRPCPVIVWICGGAFMTVDHSVWLPEMMVFARAGFVVASIEYRTTNEAPFPAQLVDVKSAVRYLRAHAEEYCVDPDHIYAMGESAGGTLASLLGVTCGCEEFEQGDHLSYDSAVQAVVDYYGLVDLPSLEPMPESPVVPPWTLEAFTGRSNENVKKASSISYVSSDTVPFLILHGTADTVVPLSQSEKLYAALQEKGVPSEYLLLEGAGHGDNCFYQAEMTQRVINFLKRIG